MSSAAVKVQQIKKAAVKARRNSRKKLKRKNEVFRSRLEFADKLNQRDPYSERWFKDIVRMWEPTLLGELHQNYVIDWFIADFVHLPTKTIIEIDDSTHNSAEAKLKDRRRDRHHREQGWLTLRIPYKDCAAAEGAIRKLLELKDLRHQIDVLTEAVIKIDEQYQPL